MTQYVACTDDCCEDVATVCETPEVAIGEWLSEQLDQWRNRTECCREDDCSHYPEEIDVHRIEYPKVHVGNQARFALERVEELNYYNVPGDLSEWPPTGQSAPLNILQAAIETAVLDYLEATTGRRDCPWWQAVESWVYVRGADGEYRRKA